MLASSVPKPGDGSEPFFPARCAPFHAPDNRVAHRMKADEPQEIAIEALEAVGAEEEAIDRRWHSHRHDDPGRSEEHTSELQSLMRISYAVFCLKKKLQKP